MSRAPSAFKQADVTRALKAARAAGVSVARFEIDPTGRIVVVAGSGNNGANEGDDLDRELAELEARNGHG